MKISAKTEYACRALMELCLHWPNLQPIQIQEVAKRRRIPMKFLVHIMIQLKQMGYVRSLRGQKGGYILTKPPKEIILSEILDFFGEINIHGKSELKNSQESDAFQLIWKDADNVLSDYFNKINFDELVKRERSLGQVPMYAI